MCISTGIRRYDNLIDWGSVGSPNVIKKVSVSTRSPCFFILNLFTAVMPCSLAPSLLRISSSLHPLRPLLLIIPFLKLSDLCGEILIGTSTIMFDWSKFLQWLLRSTSINTWPDRSLWTSLGTPANPVCPSGVQTETTWIVVCHCP